MSASAAAARAPRRASRWTSSNGITAGLAATSALGVPWTHRDHAHGVMLVTDHAREGAAGPDWAVLGAAAAQGLTLVIYMGMARLAAVQAGLLRALPGHTPAAVVQHAGTPQERACDCTLAHLAHLAQAVQASGLGSPAIVIVGHVLQAQAALAAAERRVA
jgi:uroporphyrin-III C-methyltransferase